MIGAGAKNAGSKRLALGTVQFGLPYGITNTRGQVSPADVRRILELAEAAEIPWLDTAAAYGTAEAVLGETLRRPCQFRVATKTLPLSAGVDAVIARVHESLRLLRVERLDALLVHHAEDLRTADGLWDSLQRLKQRGLVDQVGISAYAADDPLSLAKRFQPDLMQLPVSLLDQRLVLDGTLQALKAMGIAVHARSVFSQGFLFLQPTAMPPALAHAGVRLKQIQDNLQAAGIAPLQAALMYALGRPEIDQILVGVTRPDELSDIIAAATGPIEQLEWGKYMVDDPVVLNPSLW